MDMVPDLLQPINIWESTKASDQHNDMKGATNPLQKFVTILKDEFKRKQTSKQNHCLFMYCQARKQK